MALCLSVQEDIADLEKRSKKRDLREWALVILSRTLTNLFVLFILIGAGAAIFRAAQLGLSSVSLPPFPPSLPNLLSPTASIRREPATGGLSAASCLHSLQHLSSYPLLIPGQVSLPSPLSLSLTDSVSL